MLEDGALAHPTEGTPQGGSISPLLANVYLHYVLDAWLATEVAPRMTGRIALVRFADDFVLIIEHERDAERILEVLPKRFGRYGLALHPEKTKRVRFARPRRAGGPDRGAGPGTFDFLGFTHHWGKSRKGAWVVRRRTAASRQRRAINKVWRWCRGHRHDPIPEQRQTLAAKLHGHYGYYGMTGNFEALRSFHREVLRAWKQWLDRRGAPQALAWDKWRKFLERMSLPRPRIVVSHAR